MFARRSSAPVWNDTLRFLGHRVTSDNHIGDWGTQFGMIIYGYRNFLDVEAYRRKPVDELARVYRLVNRLVGYHESQLRLVELRHQIEERESELNALPKPESMADAKVRKEAEKRLRRHADDAGRSRAELTRTSREAGRGRCRSETWHCGSGSMLTSVRPC